mmetsp:Transcript_39972/g.110045  ORF Transcript_39972/g.110045 Transcript_39972/m.110045 type:complete len:102 (+) Transcript_39972:2-307(+)
MGAKVAFLRTLFEFVDDALVQGGSVLIHCLAGAHRAGTTGILLLMHESRLGKTEATKAAKAARPVINPIGGLPHLLTMYESVREAMQDQARESANDGARGA